MDEEDDSYESSSASEDSGDDGTVAGSDGEANPYADGLPLPSPTYRGGFREIDAEMVGGRFWG